MCDERAAVGTLRPQLGFHFLSPGTFGVHQRALGLHLCAATVVESIALTRSVVAYSPRFTAGAGLGPPSPADLRFSDAPGFPRRSRCFVPFALRTSAAARASAACLPASARLAAACRSCRSADLAEFGGILGGGRVLLHGGEGSSESPGFRFGFGLAGSGHDCDCLRAAADSLGVGDLGVDPSGIEPGGLIPDGRDEQSRPQARPG